VPDLPQRLHLPSGKLVRLTKLAAVSSEASPSSTLFADALHLFEHGFVLEDERQGRIEIDELRLDDFHTLRALACRVGLLSESAVSVRCRNCDEVFETRPSQALELGPFLDGELDDPDLDAPFPFGEPQPIPEVELSDDRKATTVVLSPRTVKQARPLWRALAKPSWELDASLVEAMGIHSLGEERDPEAIAQALSRASEEAFDAVLSIFDDASYPLRLRPDVRCPACAAVVALDAPASREFSLVDALPESDEPFLDLEAFEARVREIADQVYAERGVTEAVHLVVHTGVPATDDGGVPLLGSYMPGGAEPGTGILKPPEVTLYYRTFRAIWEEEGPYDLDAELRETIDHELVHHLHYLAGHDPMDDEERALIEEEASRLVGRRELSRRARAGFIADVGEFWRRTWPIWLFAALATAMATVMQR